MPQGDKSSYTSKQKRKAEHIEEGYIRRGTTPKVAKQRARATVNKEDRGGKKSGPAVGKRPTAPRAARAAESAAAEAKAGAGKLSEGKYYITGLGGLLLRKRYPSNRNAA